MSAIRFEPGTKKTLEWNYRYSSIPVLAAIFALRETACIDQKTYRHVLPTDAEGIKETVSQATNLSYELSDLMGTVALLAASHLEKFDDFDSDNLPNKEDVELARKAFIFVESIRELQAIVNEFICIANGAIPGLGGCDERK